LYLQGKVLLIFSLVSYILFTWAIGSVQPDTPFCVTKPENSSGCFKLTEAGEVTHGALFNAMDTLTKSTNFKEDSVVDISSVDKKTVITPGLAPDVITKSMVCDYDERINGILVSPPHSTRIYLKTRVEQAFLLLLLLVILSEFFGSPALAIADGVTLNHVADQPKKLGEIRLLGSVGWGLAMFVMGIVLDYSDTFQNHPCPTRNTTERNYTVCFVACTFFMFLALISAMAFRMDKEQLPEEVSCAVTDSRADEVAPAVVQKARIRQIQTAPSEGSLWIPTVKALFRGHAFLYMLSVLTIGLGAGIIFAFLFWHLQDFGGSPVLFGVASVINHGAEIAAYFYCYEFINKFGHIKLMYVCLAANIFRFLIISLLTNPWMVLPLQAIQGVTLSTAWAAASSYISLIAPAHLKGTAQTILAFVYHGIGKGFGSIVGGIIISSFGSRFTLQLYAGFAAIVLFVSFIINRFLRYEGIRYSQNAFEDDEFVGALAPQGVPLQCGDNKLTEAFNQTSTTNTNYGAIDADTTQDAYDRYVRSPYD
uniref:MFS domain-containing protein n=1 Tax=Syphacia muris TaxID=451379 RepID=A0A0N5ATI8_9BILA